MKTASQSVAPVRSRLLVLIVPAALGCQLPSAAQPERQPAHAAEARPSSPTRGASPEATSGKDIFATIGDMSISRQAFESRFSVRRAWYERGGKRISDADEARWRERVADQLLYEEALRLECERLGLSHGAEALARRQESRRATGLDHARYLAHNGESESSLLARDIAFLRESLLLDRPGAIPEPTHAQIQAEYEKLAPYYDPSKRYRTVSLIRIWRATPAQGDGSPDRPAREVAMDLYRSAVKPDADFAALAAPFMGDQVPDGRGFVARLLAQDEAHMPKSVLRKVFSMAEGQVSRPFATKDWVFVVRVDQVHGRGTPGIGGLERRIRSILARRFRAEARHDLKRDLLERYHATVLDDRA